MTVQQAGWRLSRARKARCCSTRSMRRSRRNRSCASARWTTARVCLVFSRRSIRSGPSLTTRTTTHAKYKMNHVQDLAWGAADDRTRNWREIDPRRVEGPIPVECRSASCGTCWVGVLGGAEKLSDVAVREGKKIKEFGYIDTTEPKPLIRLACQARRWAQFRSSFRRGMECLASISSR